jgi:deoxyadenosine/deoxycytidine kinase
MKASVELIAERYNRRNRRLDITHIEDMKVVEDLLEKWLGGFQADFVLEINAELEDISYSKSIPVVRDLIGSLA